MIRVFCRYDCSFVCSVSFEFVNSNKEMPTVFCSQGLDRGWIEGLDEFQAS